MGYSPWGHKKSDTTEQLHIHFQFYQNPTRQEIIVLTLKAGLTVEKFYLIVPNEPFYTGIYTIFTSQELSQNQII